MQKKKLNRKPDVEQEGSYPLYYENDAQPYQMEDTDTGVAGSADPMEWAGNWKFEDPNEHVESPVPTGRQGDNKGKGLTTKLRKKGPGYASK